MAEFVDSDPYIGVTTYDSDSCNVYQPNGLYVALYAPKTPGEREYEWGLLISVDEASCHLMTQRWEDNKWRFSVESFDMKDVEGLVVAMKVGTFDSVDEDWIGGIRKCIEPAKPKGELTDRSWALQAIYELAAAGFIDLFPKWPEVFKIEKKILAIADGDQVGTARHILTYQPVVR
ncbi:hypothetical protein KEM54_003187 [Ascosphaera aggregata]|nr:hypothetical protein KEM54_003187 [Ascosphaera aggregata]